jgi:hypothetical protein
MTYAVSILRRAQKELQQLPREDYERVRDAIRTLAHEPRPAGVSGVDRSAGSETFFDQYSRGQLSDDALYVEWANDYRHFVVLSLAFIGVG